MKGLCVVLGLLVAIILSACLGPSATPNPEPTRVASTGPTAGTAIAAIPTEQLPTPAPPAPAPTFPDLAQPPTPTAEPAEPTRAVSPTVERPRAAPSPPTGAPPPTLLVSNHRGRHVSFVHPERGVLDRVEVGAAPWGIALAPDGRAYVATAEGVAIVDTRRRTRVALVPYRSEVGEPRYGEYRPGGMGIAASPDGRRVYVAVYRASGPSRLEVLDTAKREMVGSVPVGLRPFQVLVSRDGGRVYTVDHDSFSVTVVDAASLRTRTLEAAPLGSRGGLSSFDKPHYAALRSDGHLLLPYQGRVLEDLDPVGGRSTTRPMDANTHQHGVYLTPDERRLYIVGTGPAGEAERGPNLATLNLETGEESAIPLSRPHENVAVSPDGRWAYLTGGYTFADGGWDGITVVDLRERTTRELRVPDEPLDIALLP